MLHASDIWTEDNLLAIQKTRPLHQSGPIGHLRSLAGLVLLVCLKVSQGLSTLPSV